MKPVNIGILGATGVVGQEMMKILVERGFPVSLSTILMPKGESELR